MEDFDEIPVDAQFFNVLGGVNIQLKTEPDPLSVPSAPPRPPQKSQPRPPRLILPKPPPPQPPLPVPIRPSPGIPPQYRNMPITTFAQEMERNLHDIIYESIYLFQRDPLTYHPFYLRLYKYITIGQHLGYVSVDPQIVASIWLGFSTFADDQYQKMRNGREDEQLNFTGERSPYANYLLTGKVIIEGRELPQKRGKEERSKLVKQLEEKGKLLKIQWKVKKGRTFGGGGGLRADLALKLKFFEECKAVTFPGEVEEMNKVWEEFLEVKDGGKVTPKGKVGLVQATPTPPPRQMRSAPNILKRKMAVVAAAGEGSSGKKSKLSGAAINVEEKEGPEEVDIKKEPEEEEKESRHALRRIMIKVIVVPPSSSKGSQGEGDAAVLSPPPSPSSPPAAYSPPPSPPEAFSPPASPLPSSSSRPLKKKPSTSKVASPKMKRVLKKVKRVPRRKIGDKLGKQLSIGLRALRKKKKVIFKRVMAIKGIDFKTRLIERQLKVEKLINQVKLELPDVKKNRMKKKQKELSVKGISKGKNAPATSTSNKGKASKGKQLKVKKTISKSSNVNKVKEKKIVEKVNSKKVAPAPKKAASKVVNEKKKSPLKKGKGGGRGRAKRKASSESEEEEEIPVKVQPVRRSARQPKLKFKSYGEGDGDDDE